MKQTIIALCATILVLLSACSKSDFKPIPATVSSSEQIVSPFSLVSFKQQPIHSRSISTALSDWMTDSFTVTGGQVYFVKLIFLNSNPTDVLLKHPEFLIDHIKYPATITVSNDTLTVASRFIKYTTPGNHEFTLQGLVRGKKGKSFNLELLRENATVVQTDRYSAEVLGLPMSSGMLTIE